ncbi:MAG TPA: hypothetical protein VKA46_25700 [Gemmataceae bacterium]|nr:hypothetical protein [Gemmataceae bacterium]
MALVPLAGDDGAGYSGLGSHRPVLQPLVTQEMVTTMLMPDEILVADPRGRLAPAQMVEQKLLALLRTGNPGLYAQAVGSRPDVRRTRGGPESAEARSRDA